MAFFITAAVELLWHRKAGRENRRNRPNGPLVALFWAFAAVLARRNRPIFFVVSLITTGVNVTYQDAQRKCRYNFSIFLGI